MVTRKRRPRAKDHDQWIRRCLSRSLPDETRKTFEGWPDQVYSQAVIYTGLTPDGTKATFELENGGVAIVPYPKYLRQS